MSCPGTPSLVLRSIAISQVVVIAESVIGPLVVIGVMSPRNRGSPGTNWGDCTSRYTEP